jgi:hypothetical protein
MRDFQKKLDFIEMVWIFSSLEARYLIILN